MSRISQQMSSINELPAVLEDASKKLQFHTESGFSPDEASGYAQQLDDVKEVLISDWQERLGDTKHQVLFDCNPKLGGFVKIQIVRDGAEPVVVFAENYIHFNSEMCDGSCYQYVYQKVLCYQEGLETGRVPL